MKVHADRKRIIEDFIRITDIDSVSFHERKTADVLKEELIRLGFEIIEDNAGTYYSSEAGNIYGLLRGTSDKVPMLLSAHMDTVQPGTGKKAYLGNDDRITGNGSSVLGADDVCGIVEILEAVRIVQAQKTEHRNIEVLFTVAEEVYGKGARVFDFDRVISKDAYVLDMSGAAGAAARKAPSIISFTASIKGRAAHAGFAPENGINAITAAASAVSRIKQGRISENMTINVGTIAGGKADNIVPESCLCTGEARGFDHEEALEEVQKVGRVFQEEAERAGAELKFDYDVKIRAYEVSEDDRVCRRFRNACSRTGLKGELKATHGGSDNNIFMENGIRGIVLSCGMYNTHSTEEYASVKDMEDTAELLAALISDDE